MGRRRRVYTIEEANALVPEVRAVLLQIAVEQRRLEDAAQQRDPLDGNGRSAAEPVEAERTMADIRHGIRALLGHLEALGIELRDPRMGLVDFPGERDGRPVWLCWRLSDPTVAHWHATDEGFAKRRPW